MKPSEEIAEEYRKNYEYAESQLEILRHKPKKDSDDRKRISMLEDIYYEQKGLYKRCLEEDKSGNLS